MPADNFPKPDKRTLKRRLANIALHRDALQDLAALLDDVNLARLIADVVPPGSWTRDAACQGKPVEWFFPEGQGSNPYEAQAICRSCPVIEECRSYSVTYAEPAGIWAGIGPRQRQRQRTAIRRELRSA